MIRSGWRSALPRRLVLGTAAVLIPLLAGCEAGNEAPTVEFHQPTDAATADVGQLSIRNVFVLGAPLGSSLHKGESASLFLAMVNDGAPDRLLSVSAPGSAVSVSVPTGGVPVINLHPVFLSGPTPQLVLVGLTRNLTSGSAITLKLNFQKAGQVVIVAPVVPRAAHYATYAPPQSTVTTPAAAVTPTAPASPSPSPSKT